MRLDPHTVYHHEPLFKEDHFDGTRMECFNRADLTVQNPRNELAKCPPAEQARRARLSEAEKKRSKNDGLVTNMTILDGVTAYRLGGWEAPHSRLDNVVFEREGYKRQGVRMRVITHGWVFCRWGRAKSVQRVGGVAIDEEQERRLHGDSWREGGWMGFTDLEGVRDWLGEEREAERRERERRRVELRGWEEEVLQASEGEEGPSPLRSQSVSVRRGGLPVENTGALVVKGRSEVKKVDKGKGRAEVERGVQDIVIEPSPERDFDD
ncbi:hypothetical protein PTTW11_11358 [Pyrenophora teres f. teres]|nr:hypothetical protein PTTW11_11358 [Pyrenophora teres f. teres]